MVIVSETKIRNKEVVGYICKKCTNECACLVEHDASVTSVFGFFTPSGCLYPSDGRAAEWQINTKEVIKYQRLGKF